jgi:hypothetical protein
MDAKLRTFVRERAAHRCEYCQRRQIDSPLAPLQIEHVIPKIPGKTGGMNTLRGTDCGSLV